MTKINICARAAIVHENKLLLVSTDGSYWHLPGGHIEPGEHLAICSQRETYEETGYKVIIQNIIYVFEFYDKNFDSHKIECVFRATVDTHPDSKLKWEDLGHDKSITMQRWFDLTEIQSKEYNIKPEFLVDGKWLTTENNNVYMGYEKSN